MNTNSARNKSQPIRVAIAGIGNCASALVQGLSFYGRQPTLTDGLITPIVGGYRASDIEVVAAFDIDRRKVGRNLEDAIFAEPNCALVFERQPKHSGTIVQMGNPLDGIAEHMANFSDAGGFRVADAECVDITNVLLNSQAEVFVCYVPVGADLAARYYAQACLEAHVAFVNAVPTFIASDKAWADRFRAAKLPIIGDDVKSQLGATILHRLIARLMAERGYQMTQTYQLNVGGNTDFRNMLDRRRLVSKKKSKTEAVMSEIGTDLDPRCIHIGPSDHIAWLRDNKIAYIHARGQGFGGAPIEIEVRLSVEDSPNSAAVVIDAIRCAKLGLSRGHAGPIEPACAYYMKSPPMQISDQKARQLLYEFINDSAAKAT